jgi:thymidylate synthase
MYGFQWRHFGAKYAGCKADYTSKGIDQLSKLIKGIKENPFSRRHLMTSLNVAQVEDGVLWPCHSIVTQFFVRSDGEGLDMSTYQRSADVFLGLPFNISSSALFLKLIAQQTGKLAGKLTIHLGDVHVYEEHLAVAKEQLLRTPYPFPQYSIDKAATVDDYTLEHFKLSKETYKRHGRLCAKMIA